MKIASAQILIVGGDLEGNLQRSLAAISRAKSLGADIVVLPECANFGWTHESAKEKATSILEDYFLLRIKEQAISLKIYVCFGFVERQDNLLYNSAIFLNDNGEILIHHRKINELDFARKIYSIGSDVSCVETPFGKIGVIICADALSESDRVIKRLTEQGARVILSPSAWAVPPDHDNLKNPYGSLWIEAYRSGLANSECWIVAASNVGPVTGGDWNGHFCIGNSIAVGPKFNDLIVLPFGRDAEALEIIEI